MLQCVREFNVWAEHKTNQVTKWHISNSKPFLRGVIRICWMTINQISFLLLKFNGYYSHLHSGDLFRPAHLWSPEFLGHFSSFGHSVSHNFAIVRNPGATDPTFFLLVGTTILPLNKCVTQKCSESSYMCLYFKKNHLGFNDMIEKIQHVIVAAISNTVERVYHEPGRRIVSELVLITTTFKAYVSGPLVQCSYTGLQAH